MENQMENEMECGFIGTSVGLGLICWLLVGNKSMESTVQAYGLELKAC